MEQIVAFVVFWDVTIYCIKIKNTSLIKVKKLDLELSRSVVFSLQKIIVTTPPTSSISLPESISND